MTTDPDPDVIAEVESIALRHKEGVITFAELADRLGLTHEQCYRYLDEGTLPFMYDGPPSGPPASPPSLMATIFTVILTLLLLGAFLGIAIYLGGTAP